MTSPGCSRRGIPIGWVLLDNPWETCVGNLTFDPKLIPDPAGLIKQVHALGVKFMLWVSPKVICGTGYTKSQLLGNPATQEEINLTLPAVVAKFEARLRKVFALGVDGIKGDRGDEVDLEAKSESLQNEYPLLYDRAVIAALPKDGATIFQAGSMGSESIARGIWAGDQYGTFDGLAAAIRSGETAAMSGFPTWGSDVGGYHSDGLTAELFARWAQLGAVSPVFEVGGAGANATPWTLGTQAMDALRDAAVLHYELFPDLYGLHSSTSPCCGRSATASRTIRRRGRLRTRSSSSSAPTCSPLRSPARARLPASTSRPANGSTSTPGRR